MKEKALFTEPVFKKTKYFFKKSWRMGRVSVCLLVCLKTKIKERLFNLSVPLRKDSKGEAHEVIITRVGLTKRQ